MFRGRASGHPSPLRALKCYFLSEDSFHTETTVSKKKPAQIFKIKIPALILFICKFFL